MYNTSVRRNHPVKPQKVLPIVSERTLNSSELNGLLSNLFTGIPENENAKVVFVRKGQQSDLALLIGDSLVHISCQHIKGETHE